MTEASTQKETVETARAVTDLVAAAFASGDIVLLLGGDCTIELGAVAGALYGEHSVGLVYIDLDVDLNVPNDSDGALDWTGVAHLLDLPGVEPRLSSLGPRQPLLTPADVLFFAADNIEPREARTIEERGMTRISLADVKTNPSGAARKAVDWAARYKRVLIHLDVDVLSFTDFPIAENTRRRDGLTFEELSTALASLLAAPNWRALTLCEINPDHAPNEAEAFSRLIAMICASVAGAPPQARPG